MAARRETLPAGAPQHLHQFGDLLALLGRSAALDVEVIVGI